VNTLTVLLVHPSPHLTRAIVEAIEAAGHRTVLCAMDTDAIETFRDNPSDAAIIHVVPRKREGLAIAKRIRETQAGAQLPLILTSEGNVDPLKLEKLAEQIRATAFVLSEDNIPILARLVEDIVHRSPTKPSVSAHLDLSTADQDKSVSHTGETSREHDERRTKVDDEPESDESPALSWKSGDDPEAEQEGLSVEAQARLIDQGIALKGDLKSTPFPRLLRTLAEERTTGALVVCQQDDERGTTTGEKPKKIVYFRNGIPIYVQSNIIHECLGHLLIRLGKISRAMFDESIQRMRNEHKKQGSILIELGVLTEDELTSALREQLRRKLFDLFGWRGASYQLSTDQIKFPGQIELGMSLAEVVFEGVVRQIPAQRLLRILEPHMGAFVVPNPSKAEAFLRMDLVDEAKEALLSLDGTQQLQELLQHASKRPGAVAQLLYAMASMEAVWFLPQAQPGHSIRELEPEPDLIPIASPEPFGLYHSTTAEAPIASPEEPFEYTEVTSGETPNQRPKSKIRSVEKLSKPMDVDAAEHTNPDHLDRQVEITFQAERIFRSGKKAFDRNLLDDAAALFSQAEQLCPDEPEFVLYRAYTQYLLAEQDTRAQHAALLALERAQKLAPSLYEGHVFYARALVSQQRLEEAQAAYKAAIALRPERLEALTELKQLEVLLDHGRSDR
jgi:tetratricopeptide (TPR) repeat protein